MLLEGSFAQVVCWKQQVSQKQKCGALVKAARDNLDTETSLIGQLIRTTIVS